jgi:hypothetical protein
MGQTLDQEQGQVLLGGGGGGDDASRGLAGWLKGAQSTTPRSGCRGIRWRQASTSQELGQASTSNVHLLGLSLAILAVASHRCRVIVFVCVCMMRVCA